MPIRSLSSLTSRSSPRPLRDGSLCYVVDRTSGNPIAGAATRVWIDQQEIANKADRSAGNSRPAHHRKLSPRTWQCSRLIRTRSRSTRRARGTWVRNRALCAATLTPIARCTGPGDTVHFKTIVRTETPTRLRDSAGPRASTRVARSSHLQPIWQQTVTLSDMGTAHWDYADPRRR